MTSKAKADRIIAFWRSIGPEGWFRKDDGIDEKIRTEFGAVHASAASGALDEWQETPESCLALVLLLDQFSRNLFRDDPRAFAQDEQARRVAAKAIDRGMHREVGADVAWFFNVPFLHSESLADQDRCAVLSHAGGPNLKHALEHRDIIRRFGRFPHRNAVLGRHTTLAERIFLEEGGFKG